MTVQGTPIRDLQDLFNRIIAASKAATAGNAKSIADEIDHELATTGIDPVGTLSVNEVVSIVDQIGQQSVTGNTKPAPVDHRIMADAIEDDLIERTVDALAAKSGRPRDQVETATRLGVRAGGSGNFDTQHIEDTIKAIANAARRQDSSLPELDDQADTDIVSHVIDDVRQKTAVTLANEMVPPAARIDGGYPSSGPR
jgi:hypothetical protein